MRAWVALWFVLAGCEPAMLDFEMLDVGVDAGPRRSDAGLDATDPRDLFERDVVGLLDTNCASCHVQDRSGPAFLVAEPDLYTFVTQYPSLVNRSVPRSSLLLAKGTHAGPAWTGPQESVILRWLSEEARQANRDAGELELLTEPQLVAVGSNTIPLDGLELAGAALQFIAQRVGEGLVLSDVRVVAGPAGVSLVRPVVVSFEAGVARPDPADSLAAVRLDVAAFSQALITESVAVIGFDEGEQLSFVFDELGPYMPAIMMPDAGTPTGMTGGCSNVPSFLANVAPQVAGTCFLCHGGGNPSAQAAVDMSGTQSDDPSEQALACSEIKNRMNAADPAMSALFAAPGGRIPGHPFRHAGPAQQAAFEMAVLTWFESE